MIVVRIEKAERLEQGDILRNVEYLERFFELDGVIELTKIVFPYVVVLTQDCDLEQDHRFRFGTASTQDKFLISALVAPMYNAYHVYAGEHLSELAIKSAPINRDATEGKYLRQNQRPRYHYLEFAEQTGLVASIVDFKHYFSVAIPTLQRHKRDNFVCRLGALFREDLAQRFGSYLARIGLPAGEGGS